MQISFQQALPCFVGLCLAGLACLPSQAATMRFTPAGGQLDADAIFDIADISSGQTITFSNYFNNSQDFLSDSIFGVLGGLSIPTRLINYVITYDPNELQYVSSVLDVPNKISDTCDSLSQFPSVQPCGSTTVPGVGTLTVSHNTANNNLLAPQAEFLLDTITFVGTNVNLYPGDGLSDYSFSGSNNINTIVIGTFGANMVELQQGAVPQGGVQQKVPAPLPLLAAGAAFGSIRKLQRFAGLLNPNPIA